MAKIDIELPGGQKAGQTLQELQKEAGRLNKEIAKLPIGSKEFIEKSKKLSEVNTSLSQVRNQIKGTNDASNQLKNTWSQFIPFSGQFQAIGQQITGTSKNVGGLVSSFKSLRGAIIATGIGALIVLLGALISYFTTTQEGIDKVTAVTRPLSAIFERLKGVLQELGQKVFKQIAEAVENPKQAFIDLVNVIKNMVIRQFQALALFGPALKKIFSGDLAGGFKDLGNAFIQLTTGIENGIDKIADAGKELVKIIDEAVEKGRRLDELQKQIERGEINQIKRHAELNLIMKQQRDIYEDSTKSLEERTAAAEREMQARDALLNSELSLLDKRIEKMKIEQSLNDTSRENEKELAQLEAKRMELQAQAIEERIKVKKKILQFEKEHAAQELAIAKNLEDLRVQAMEEGIEKEIAQIELNTERKIEALTGSAEQILEQELLLQTIREQEIQAVIDRFEAERAAKDEKAKKEAEAREKKLADEKKRIAEEQAEFERAMEEMRMDMLSEGQSFATELVARGIKDQEAAKKVRKVGGLVELGINAQRESSANALKGADIAASIPGPAGVAAGAAYTAGANLRTGIRAAIMAAKIIAFRRGGVIKGPSHEEGGIDFTVQGKPGFNMEGDEIILTRGVYRNPALRRMASAINVLGGGRKFFASGGPVSPSASNGGSVSRSTADAAASSALGMDEIKSLLSQNLQAINTRIDNIRVINVATDTEDVLATVNKIRNEADI